ncbi:MAG: alpha/beta hydrolase [Rouxiella aceris]|uniref:alpha/beta fold hydrolase n=1 Tax=Rouxiella aceris TaxID=2703884 RepID=UPI00285206F8|nr:alpha/beta hydrolase [Rouxiella aceris]MDR3432141.1 alpha/beta hydrolase [Rouxiella aceris]
MRPVIQLASIISLMLSVSYAFATDAVTVLGENFTFPNKIEGLPQKLSDFKGLQINEFITSDNVKLSYWEAGSGEPLIFIPGWGANGAEYVNVLYLLSKQYHVYVLDPRNQGLSQNVEYGTRLSRYGMDLKEFTDHLGVKSANLCGWSMGASVIWSYIDLFGTKKINKLIIIDEPVSIYTHSDWSEEQRQQAGGMTTSPERMVAAFTTGAPSNNQVVDLAAMERYKAMDSKYFQNSEAFAHKFIKNDPKYLSLVLFDHATNDWSDVIRHKINVPTAIFTGDYSHNVPSQKWIHSVIPGSELFVYTKEEQGDHFLAFKNPLRFTYDLVAFLKKSDPVH